MCGRYLVEDEVYADMWMYLNSEFGVGNSDPGAEDRLAALESKLREPLGATQKLAKGEVYPTNIAPVFTRDGAAGVKWGFPHWKTSGVIINARSETALQKNMFKGPLLKRRCVIPSSGFYEWSRTGGGKKKDKYLLRQPDTHLLYMAGMINVFRDADGNDYSAFVILTTEANESVASIHDRMPVILTPDERDRWLNDDEYMEHIIHRAGPVLDLASVD